MFQPPPTTHTFLSMTSRLCCLRSHSTGIIHWSKLYKETWQIPCALWRHGQMWICKGREHNWTMFLCGCFHKIISHQSTNTTYRFEIFSWIYGLCIWILPLYFPWQSHWAQWYFRKQIIEKVHLSQIHKYLKNPSHIHVYWKGNSPITQHVEAHKPGGQTRN